MADWRTYAVTLQVVVAIPDDYVTDNDLEDIEEQIQDVGSYTLLAPWESDVIAVMVPALNDGTGSAS